jgi:hypothetical protein
MGPDPTRNRHGRNVAPGKTPVIYGKKLRRLKRDAGSTSPMTAQRSSHEHSAMNQKTQIILPVNDVRIIDLSESETWTRCLRRVVPAPRFGRDVQP